MLNPSKTSHQKNSISIAVKMCIRDRVGTTVASISNNIEALLPELQKWAVSTFPDSEEISLWIQSLEFNWDKIIQTAIDFLKNGAGNVLNSTFTVAKTVINSLMNFCVAFVFACYILLQKEKMCIRDRSGTNSYPISARKRSFGERKTFGAYRIFTKNCSVWDFAPWTRTRSRNYRED